MAGVKIKFPVCLQLLLYCLIVSAIAGCDRGTHVGTYIAEINNSTRHHETTLELKENGVGVWRAGEDEVNFSWYVKDGELRLNTRNGGVIVGTLDNDVIRVSLPGSSELFFKKLK